MQFGEYIHLTAKNYRIYGINRASHGKNGITAAAAISSTREKIKQRCEAISVPSITKTTNLEKKINNFINWLGKDTKNKKREQDREYLNKIVLSAYDEALAKVDWTNLDVSIAESRIGTIDSKNKQGTSYTKIASKIRQLNSITEDLKKGIANVDNFNQIPSLEKKLEVVRNLYKDNYAELRRIISSSLGENISTEEKDMIKTLNYLIENYVPVIDIAQMKQDLFKGIMDLIFVKGNELGEEEFFDRIEQVRYNPNFFVKGMARKGKINVNREDNFGDLTRTIRTSPQNINIEFNYYRKENQALLKNIDLAPNNKNKGQEITLVQGESLLNYLQDEDADFVNHYFNLFTTHEGRGSWGGDKRAALETIKLISLYKSITGDSYGKNNKAELFIINNSAGAVSQVKVYSIYDILKRANRYLDNYAFFRGAAFNNNFLYRNDRVKGRWARTGTQRIAKVLNQAHQMKIAVGINSRMLSKL